MPFCRSQMLLASGRYGIHGAVSVPLFSFSCVTICPTKAASRSDLRRAQCPYLDAISRRNRATVSASRCGTAFISTNLEKLSIATRRYRFPFRSGRLNTIKSYEVSRKGLDTINECLHLIFSLNLTTVEWILIPTTSLKNPQIYTLFQ